MDLVRRIPVTLTLLALCAAASLVVVPLGGNDAVGYGLPSALDGAWWTFLVGALVTPTLGLVPVLLALLGSTVGALERRIGSERTAAAVLLTHLAGTIGAAGVLVVGRLLPWPWADGLSRLSDTGPSAAAVGALAVLSATMRLPLRRLVVTGVGAYLVVMVVVSGLLWDLEHLLAFGAGLALAPSLTGSVTAERRERTSTIGRVRACATLLVVMTAVAGLVQAWFPGYGGFLGSGHTDPRVARSAVLAGLLLLGALVLGDGLRRGARWAWATGPGGAGVTLLVGILAGWSVGTLTCLVAMVGLGVAHHRLRRLAPERPAGGVDVRTRLRLHGGGNLGWQHTWAGSETWTTADEGVAISYRPSAGVAIVVADPIGPRFRWYAASQEFVEHCREQGLVPAWYAVSAAFLIETGREQRAVRIGEDAVVDLSVLEIRGKAWQDVRTARNRAGRDGITMRRVQLTEPALVGQVEAISSAWVDGKPLPEMGFTLGGMREARDPEVRVHVALDEAGVVHGVVSWLPVHRDGEVVGWTLDLMRRRDTGFRPVMEFLIAESLIAFQGEGFETASLSVAPLARSTDGAPDGTLERLLGVSGTLLEPVYGFGSLLAFKRKFSPHLRPVHLAYESALDLPLIAVAVARAYVPVMSLGQVRHVVRLVLSTQSWNRQPSSSSSATTAGSASRRRISTAASLLPQGFSRAQSHSAAAATISSSGSITRRVSWSGRVAKIVRRRKDGKPWWSRSVAPSSARATRRTSSGCITGSSTDESGRRKRSAST